MKASILVPFSIFILGTSFANDHGYDENHLKTCLAVSFEAQEALKKESGHYATKFEDLKLNPKLKKNCKDFEFEVKALEKSFTISAKSKGKIVGEVNEKKEISLP